MDDVILNKTEIIRRCLKRIREEYVGHEEGFETNFTKQDSVILNLQRACEASLDLGMRIIKVKKLELPQNSNDVFVTLEKAQVLDPDLSMRLQKMVGFRNVAVHEYQKLNLEIVKSILSARLGDFEQWVKVALFYA